MIAIYSNSGGYGGVEVLVSRLIQYLYEKEVPFCVIEPKGTRLFNEISWSNPVDPADIKSIDSKITSVIFPSVSKLRDRNFPWKNLQKAKMIVWVVHPNDPFARFFPFVGKTLPVFGYSGISFLKKVLRNHYEKVSSLFELLQEGHSILTMDGATTRSINYFYPKTKNNIKILPIPSFTSALDELEESTNDIGSIGYFGRVDGFKFSAIASTVKTDLKKIAKKQKINFHVIGDGSHLSKLRSLCNECNIDMVEYGFRSNYEARKIIKTKTRFAIAMGTSALDIAASAHPCIFIDPALGLIAPTQSTFKFVHQAENYTLGEFRDFPGYVSGINSFEECLSQIESVNVGYLDFEYVKLNHDQNTIFSELLKYLSNSNTTIDRVGELISEIETSFDSLKNKLHL